MTLFVAIIVLVSALAKTQSDVGLRGPPHVTNEMPSSYRVRIGETIRLDCPIESGPSLQMYYEWKKDGETISPAWDRFRMTPKKLRIKEVLAEDGGLYQCKGTNGFGSKQLSTRLIVEDENGKVVGGFENEKNEGNQHQANKNFFPDEILEIRRPSFTEITEPPTGSTFRPNQGSSLTLKCHVDGHPSPTVAWIWLKDNLQVPKATGEELELSRVDVGDSGIYACIASNPYGQVNASFIVEVNDNGMEGPSIISLDASNLTATKGQLIHFRCLISSDTFPNVKWLRQLGDEEIDSDGSLQMAGVRYKVLGSTSLVSAFQNGTYISEMSLPMEDRATGIVCLATNSGGFKYETTTVTYVQNSEIRDGDGQTLFPMAMLIAIPATLVVLFGVLTILFCCVRKSQSRSRTLGMVTTATTYATPRDATTNDYQTPPPVPFYNIRQHSYTTHQFGHGQGPVGSRGSNPNFGSQQYFLNRENPSPFKNPHHSSPAYASVPICDLPGNRAPPLPSRTFPNQSLRTGDRNSYNAQGLMTQPLLTQTGSSSDSRESRHSSGVGHRSGGDFCSNLAPSQRPNVDQWCMSSEGSEGSWDRKNSRNNHQIRV